MDQIFENAPVNHRTLELKEELIANALEKYNDLILRGYGEDEAFQQVVGSIGDVQQLFADMGTDDDYSQAYYLQWAKEAQEKKAALTAVSTGFFLLAAAVLVISFLLYWYNVKLIYINGQNLNLLGIGIAMLICIVPVSLMVYAHKIQPPEELADFAVAKNRTAAALEARKRRRRRFKQIKGSLEGLMWLLIVIFYFIISFATRAWYITWIIFLGGAAVECLLDALTKIFFPVDKD
ncbi:MAG: permease prefix domain 1-containing protein [Acetatifactor sp.]|nr:permease prefix domain 1-containing protein [Acetatifactor sp.]